MKLLITFFLFLSVNLVVSQQIDSKNYYDFFSKGTDLKGKNLRTSWLDKKEVAAILEEEMKKAGHEWISTFSIVKIDSQTYVTSICFSGKSNFGFLYESTHEAFPKKENRQLKSLYKEMTGNDYAEKILDIDGKSTFTKIKDVPSNLIIIKEDSYWYQSTDNSIDDRKLVTKEIIITILRSDIREILSKIKI